MHTDEYEISLSRELAVCKNAKREIQKALKKLERKYGIETAKFMEGISSGNFDDHKDFTYWIEQYHALRRWEERQKQYEHLFAMLKI